MISTVLHPRGDPREIIAAGVHILSYKTMHLPIKDFINYIISLTTGGDYAVRDRIYYTTVGCCKSVIPFFKKLTAARVPIFR